MALGRVGAWARGRVGAWGRGRVGAPLGELLGLEVPAGGLQHLGQRVARLRAGRGSRRRETVLMQEQDRIRFQEHMWRYRSIYGFARAVSMLLRQDLWGTLDAGAHCTGRPRAEIQINFRFCLNLRRILRGLDACTFLSFLLPFCPPLRARMLAPPGRKAGGWGPHAPAEWTRGVECEWA